MKINPDTGNCLKKFGNFQINRNFLIFEVGLANVADVALQRALPLRGEGLLQGRDTELRVHPSRPQPQALPPDGGKVDLLRHLLPLRGHPHPLAAGRLLHVAGNQGSWPRTNPLLLHASADGLLHRTGRVRQDCWAAESPSDPVRWDTM